MITFYSFGHMIIDGQEFHKDLIILPDGTIHHPWRRESGHRLTLEDIDLILTSAPKILIVGSGSVGLMTPDRSLAKDLKAKGTTIKMMPTQKAVTEYNTLISKGEKVAACFHLTC